MDHYSPPTLFRQNAMTSKMRSVSAPHDTRLYHQADREIINKTLPSPKSNICSNYWRIPDDELFLTSISVNKENPEQLAVASGKCESNLFIYDIDYKDMSLTHQQTISLPYIQSTQWLGYDKAESLLLTGHRNGSAHIVSIPDSNSEESASIIKRFNHKKHFTSNYQRSISVDQLVLPNWINNRQNFLSSCNESIFLWDMHHRSDLPILKTQHLGLLSFDASLAQNGMISLAGDFGIALNDLRAPTGTPSVFSPRQNLGASNCIKWAPYDSNVLAASHIDGTVRLWDIRAQNSFGKLAGHKDMVTSIQWSEESSADLYTGGKDGCIIHWDVPMTEDLSECCLREGLESVKYMADQFFTDDKDIYANLKRRQCGSLIPAAKTSIVDMCSTGSKILSIDSSAFLGAHDKRGADSFTVEEGTSDTIMEEMLSEFPILSVSSSPGSPSSSSRTLYEASPQSSPVISVAKSSSLTLEPSLSKPLTKLENDSTSTLVEKFELLLKGETSNTRRVSGDTLHDSDGTDYSLSTDVSRSEEVEAAFTYEKIVPLDLSMKLLVERQPMAYI